MQIVNTQIRMILSPVFLYMSFGLISRLPRQRQQQEGFARGRQGLEEAVGLSLLQGPEGAGPDAHGP